jgi:hypothetical protein
LDDGFCDLVGSARSSHRSSADLAERTGSPKKPASGNTGAMNNVLP